MRWQRHPPASPVAPEVTSSRVPDVEGLPGETDRHRDNEAGEQKGHQAERCPPDRPLHRREGAPCAAGVAVESAS